MDVEALYLSQPDSGEQALYVLDALVRSGAVDLVVVDSPERCRKREGRQGGICNGICK